MDKVTLKAEERKIFGRKIKNLRKQGLTPANVFGRKIKSQSIQTDAKEFDKVYSEVGETGLVELLIGKEKKPVLIHNIQKDPLNDQVLHVDFLQVDLKQKVTAQVPVELVGESPAEKQGLGTVVQYINEIEVEALPENLPDKFELDLSTLSDINETIQVKDIKVDKEKIEIKKGEEEILIKVEPPKEEKEEVVTPVPEGEGVEGAATESEVKSDETETQKGKESSEENPKAN